MVAGHTQVMDVVAQFDQRNPEQRPMAQVEDLGHVLLPDAGQLLVPFVRIEGGKVREREIDAKLVRDHHACSTRADRAAK